MNQADTIRQARLGMRLTQNMVAARARVSSRTIIRAERGKPILDDNLLSICAVLGLDATSLHRPLQAENPTLSADADAKDLQGGGPGVSEPALETPGERPAQEVRGTNPDMGVAMPRRSLKDGFPAKRHQGSFGRIGKTSARLAVACAILMAGWMGELRGQRRGTEMMASAVLVQDRMPGAGLPGIGAAIAESRDSHDIRHSEQQILQWASETMSRTFSADFANYDNQMNDLKPRFTVSGWRGMQAANHESGFKEQIVNRHLVSTGTVIGSPVIVRGPDVDSLPTWLVRIPMAVTLQGNVTSMVMHLDVTATVVQQDDPDRTLGVSSFVAATVSPP